MKEKECQAIRRHIEEREPSQDLSSIVGGHLRQCRSCHSFYETDAKLRQLVASLPAVEAPADFDFRLRARLANERSSKKGLIGNLSFGVPSVALAAMVIMAGGFFLLRSVNTTKPPSIATTTVQSRQPENKNTSSKPLSGVEETKVAKSNATAAVPDRKAKGIPRRQLVALKLNDRLVTKDSSSVGASVVNRNGSDSLTDRPLVFPVQTLKVSLDDGTGVARTISFPTVSFGSERVLTRAGNSFQPPGKSDW